MTARHRFRQACLAAIAAIALGGIATSNTSAGIVEFSFAEVAKGYWRQFEDIARRRGLDRESSDMAQGVASRWYYAGPCKGKVDDDSRSEVFSAIAFVNQAESHRPVDGAILEMIAVLTRADFGRPSEITCRFAKETGFPITATKR